MSILIDTGVLYAYFNPFDAYHDTVKNLFDTYVFNDENVLFLFVNPTIVNLVQEDVLLVLVGDKDSVLRQIGLTNHLGAADAVNVSMASLYGRTYFT